MFRNFKEYYPEARKQHNLMVLVGNGFDISVMHEYQNNKLPGILPTYAHFYEFINSPDYVCDFFFNEIFLEMESDRENGKENWCDFEMIVDRLLKNNRCNYSNLRVDLDIIQQYFSRFLNDLVTADVLIDVNEACMSGALARKSLSKFLGDLSANDCLTMNFVCDHYDIFNFLFVNFNYTMLLDNYLYLDRNQFDPVSYRTVDRNFSFYPAPQIPVNMSIPNADTVYSSYLVTDIVHPHGYMDIPRSMIFGTELENYDAHGQENEKLFVKSYWARDDLKYSGYFENTELFIIYGMSIANTDAWWFDHVYDRLANSSSELIIYWYDKTCGSGEKVESSVKSMVKQRFIDACNRNGSDIETNRKVKDKIYVVIMRNNNTYFLGVK